MPPCAHKCLVLVEGAGGEARTLEGPDCHDRIGCGGIFFRSIKVQLSFVSWSLTSLIITLTKSMGSSCFIASLYVNTLFGATAVRIAEEKQLMVLLYREFALW